MYRDCVKRGLLTGEEDMIFLGSDNFVIHNDSFSREDLYRLWSCVKGYTKWGCVDGGYLRNGFTGISEA